MKTYEDFYKLAKLALECLKPEVDEAIDFVNAQLNQFQQQAQQEAAIAAAQAAQQAQQEAETAKIKKTTNKGEN